MHFGQPPAFSLLLALVLPLVGAHRTEVAVIEADGGFHDPRRLEVVGGAQQQAAVGVAASHYRNPLCRRDGLTLGLLHGF